MEKLFRKSECIKSFAFIILLKGKTTYASQRVLVKVHALLAWNADIYIPRSDLDIHLAGLPKLVSINPLPRAGFADRAGGKLGFEAYVITAQQL